MATWVQIADRLRLTAPGARSLSARTASLERSDPAFRNHLDALELRITQLKTRV